MAFTSGLSFTVTTTMIVEICCSCGVAFGIPSDLRNEFKADENKWFYCPNGHRQHYSESEATRLQRELRQAQAAKERAERDLTNQMKLRAEADRKLKRLNKGVCSCCNKSFVDLHKHMKTKHPEVVGKAAPVSPIHKKINKKPL